MKLLSIALAASLAAGALSAATISYIDMFRNQYYTQSSNSQPAAPGSYNWATRVFLQNPGDFTSGTVTPPGGSARNFALTTATLLSYDSPGFSTLSAFNTDFPTGTYNYLLNPGGTALTETRPADQNPTAVPFLTDYSSIQNMNAALPFTANFNSFTGALSNPNASFVFFTIFRQSDNAVIFDAGFQPSNTTSDVLPANTLQPGTAYSYQVIFSNRFFGTNTSGSSAFPPQFGFDFRTSGTFTTSALTPVPEPTSCLLLMAGLPVIAFRRKKWRRRPAVDS